MPLNIPTRDECFHIINEAEMMPHIIMHSRQVSRVALFLTDRFDAIGIELNRDLIFAAALLHDITKTRSFTTGENHAQSGAEMISQLGYPEVGSIIAQHVRLRHFGFQAPYNEAEIVNYADKRVLHENVVSLEDRMDYIIERYGVTPDHQERIQHMWQEARQLEQKLFAPLQIDAGDLVAELYESPPKEPV